MELMFFLIALFVAFYFILLRPVLKQQKQQRREMSDLRVGDEVLTSAGIFATVAAIDVPETGPIRLTLELAPGVRVQAVPQAILQRVTEKGESEAPQLSNETARE